MKRYHDIVGDGGSRILEQVAEQRTRIADGLARVCHLVAVGSGKGGVGKSTLTLHLIDGDLVDEELRWTDEARKGLWTMKNAYQRRRVKARVERRSHDEARRDHAQLRAQVIEEETRLEIQPRSANMARPAPHPTEHKTRGGDPAGAERGEVIPASDAEDGTGRLRAAGQGIEARLIARDDKKNLIATYSTSSSTRALESQRRRGIRRALPPQLRARRLRKPPMGAATSTR